MKYAVETASDGTMYVSGFSKIGSGIQVIITSTIWEASVLVLLTTGIYDVPSCMTIGSVI
jgi:hypothetical protein